MHLDHSALHGNSSVQDLHPNVSASARALPREGAPTGLEDAEGTMVLLDGRRDVLGSTCPSCKVKKCQDRRMETAHSRYVCRGKYEHPRAEENSWVPQAWGFTL